MSETLTCRHAREGLTEYLENALSSTRRQGMEHHLEQCEGCRGYLAQIRLIGGARSLLGPKRMPLAMKRRLLQAFQEQDPT